MEKDHLQLWEECRQIIKDNVSPAQYDTWFRDITSRSFDGVKLMLSVPSALFMEQLENLFRDQFIAAILKTYGKYGKVQLFYEYFNKKDDPGSAVHMRSSEPSSVILNGTNPQKPAATAPVQDVNPNLNARYNFENYCSGASNRLAWGVGQSIANDPTIKTYNPLFVFGNTGVGKTHLIQAIGIRIKERNPLTKVLYVTAREFQSQYTAAETSGNTNGFFHFYQSIDTLIIDDIQDLRGKPKTQNTFYHIFNHLHQNGKQIIMSSDCSPADMEGFEERLLSRFRWGMNARLENPDPELRRNVLCRKAQQDGLELPDEVIDYIAANITDSIRELEGIV
ncbi:MAG: ATP-binding protein, partial [Muribaculaceae bacterium]|nr:ATP-binding protein [Muribaculaceae bacterium]